MLLLKVWLLRIIEILQMIWSNIVNSAQLKVLKNLILKKNKNENIGIGYVKGIVWKACKSEKHTRGVNKVDSIK